jgi:hypothetical protein
LVAFLSFTLRVEVRELLMWQRMIHTDASTLGWLKAADKALSGDAPCSGCMSISKMRISGEEDQGFAAPTTPCPELLLSRTEDIGITPHARFSPFDDPEKLLPGRFGSPPEPPPV